MSYLLSSVVDAYKNYPCFQHFIGEIATIKVAFSS